ncbi:MAG: hypothetical protein OTJ44_02515 [Planctomycetota bacterium]|nr:hypothetical protein [Planctomycetota bacterium]
MHTILPVIFSLSLSFLILQTRCTPAPSAPLTAEVLEALDLGALKGPEALLARAEAAESRLNQPLTAAEGRQAKEEIERMAKALSLLPLAPELPWVTWIEKRQHASPLTATALLSISGPFLSNQGVTLADSLDDRNTQTDLRLKAHQILWANAPGIAIARANRLFFAEKTRGNEQIRPRYLQEILPPTSSPFVAEFLLRCAKHSGQDTWTRRIAIQKLIKTKNKAAAQHMASIFLSETDDLNIKKEAFHAALKLDPKLGHRFLMTRVPNAESEPILYEFFRFLRKEEGLPKLPPGPSSPDRPR